MRKRAEYARPSYHDPNDRRLVSLIKKAGVAAPRAVNIVGVPFDGAVLGRKGAAGGPAAIRLAMSSFSNYNRELGVDLLDARVFDVGDVQVDQEDVAVAHRQIERDVRGLIGTSSLLVILGGDNSVSLPSLRAFSKKFKKVGLVVVDSHFDLRGEIRGRPTSGSSYGLAIKTLPGLDPRRVVEVGIHGFLNSKVYAEKAERLGVMVYTAEDVRKLGAKEIAKRAFERAIEGADALYVSIDLDAVDLSYVSGVSAPSAGGITAAELFDLAYNLGARELVKCADIVELAPSLDPIGRSQLVAATTLVSLIAGYHSRSTKRA